MKQRIIKESITAKGSLIALTGNQFTKSEMEKVKAQIEEKGD